jgi:hypothetical protein
MADNPPPPPSNNRKATTAGYRRIALRFVTNVTILGEVISSYLELRICYEAKVLSESGVQYTRISGLFCALRITSQFFCHSLFNPIRKELLQQNIL